jgi:hypothetical protein
VCGGCDSLRCGRRWCGRRPCGCRELAVELLEQFGGQRIGLERWRSRHAGGRGGGIRCSGWGVGRRPRGGRDLAVELLEQFGGQRVGVERWRSPHVSGRGGDGIPRCFGLGGGSVRGVRIGCFSGGLRRGRGGTCLCGWRVELLDQRDRKRIGGRIGNRVRDRRLRGRIVRLPRCGGRRGDRRVGGHRREQFVEVGVDQRLVHAAS